MGPITEGFISTAQRLCHRARLLAGSRQQRLLWGGEKKMDKTPSKFGGETLASPFLSLRIEVWGEPLAGGAAPGFRSFSPQKISSPGCCARC